MAIDVPFVLFLSGVLLCGCSSLGVYSLVSSLNVDEGLGTWSLALAYGTSLLIANLTPVIGCYFGCKKLLTIAEISWLLFILGNMYTSYYTVLPAGFFLGCGEAFGWTALPIITTYFGKRRASADPANVEKHVRYYTGYYFGVLQGSIVVGNAINFAILHIDRSLADANTSHNTTKRNIDYSVCGANDCQIGNITGANMEQYTPAFPITRYALIAVYAVLMICCIILHSIVLPNDINWNLTVPKSSANQEIGTAPLEIDLVDRDSKGTAAETNNRKIVEEKSLIKDSSEKEETVSLKNVFMTTIKATIKIAFNPKHLLVVLLAIYNGMTIGFVVGELTRAYASCILSVGKVGVCIMLFSTADCVFSLIAGKMAGKLGRNLPYFIAFVIDIGLYVFSIHWEFNAGNEWLVYIIFLMFGCSDGIWQTLVTAMYGEYFVEEQQLALNLWNVVLNFGFLIQYAMSTAFCVYTKLYIQITVLCVAVGTYAISQFIYYPPETCRDSEVTNDHDEIPKL
uniref:Protein unc-93 homolog A-like n=1 Tax=Phallusia mammillata TaxID=59560 RepID=A0A6F9DX18_9ASCI|nr:protein unc-93 homolog A-like [Phallusia mammillata]